MSTKRQKFDISPTVSLGGALGGVENKPYDTLVQPYTAEQIAEARRLRLEGRQKDQLEDVAEESQGPPPAVEENQAVRPQAAEEEPVESDEKILPISEDPDFGIMSIHMSHELRGRLKNYGKQWRRENKHLLKKFRSLLGFSAMVETILTEYLDQKEKK